MEKAKILPYGLVLVLCFSGCRAASAPAGQIPGTDLSDFSEIARDIPKRHATATSRLHRFPVRRNGLVRDSIVLEAAAVVRAPLPRTAGKFILVGYATPLFNIGDGVQMDLIVLKSGAARTVFSRYLDPGRKMQDRAWISLEIPLDLDGAVDNQLEVRVSAGPQGDLVGDWVALSPLRLIREGTGP